jgi:hypothetical protein
MFAIRGICDGSPLWVKRKVEREEDIQKKGQKMGQKDDNTNGEVQK